MDKRKSINIIKEFITNLRKDYDTKKVIFFGSRAVGKPHKDSDIDLIIVSDDFEDVNRIERGASMYNYWPWLIPVDFICYTTKEFNTLKKRISIVKEALRSSGKRDCCSVTISFPFTTPISLIRNYLLPAPQISSSRAGLVVAIRDAGLVVAEEYGLVVEWLFVV